MISHDQQSVFLDPPRGYYCAFCDQEQPKLCQDVHACKYAKAQAIPADNPMRGIILGVGLSVILWGCLWLGARLIGWL